MKISKKKHSDLGSRVPQDLQVLGHFSRNFCLVKDGIELGEKWGYKHNKLRGGLFSTPPPPPLPSRVVAAAL